MNVYVLSVGGSLIFPENIDVNFLKNFKKLIVKRIIKGDKFILISGGGRIARNYINAGKELGITNDSELDYLGISGTVINAGLLKRIFKEKANKEIIDYENLPKFNNDVMVFGGWKPKHSTDFCAVHLSVNYNVSMVINLSNISYVYDKDPKKNKNAKPLKKINWKDFRKMVGNEWVPGANHPFDPIASKLAEKENKKVIVLKGDDLENLEKVFEKKNFIGTIIS